MTSLSMSLGTLAYRALGAAVLERGTYEGIEHDRRATGQAVVVVVAASLAAGIGAAGGHPQPVVLMAVTALALVTWVSWAMIVLHIGGRYFAERQTHVDLGQLLRTTGFAASPGLLQVFAVIPEITVPVYLASWLWMLAAMTVAVRQALDFRTMRRALAVCGVAFALVLAVAITLAMLFSPSGGPGTGASAARVHGDGARLFVHPELRARRARRPRAHRLRCRGCAARLRDCRLPYLEARDARSNRDRRVRGRSSRDLSVLLQPCH